MRTVGRDFDVLIVGAGVIGTSMASLLVARRLVAPERIAVIAERLSPASTVPQSEWDLRVLALSRASQRVLGWCGTWAALPPGKMCAYERMCVWDSRGEPGGAGSLIFDSAEFGESNLGFIVESRALQAQSLRMAGSAGVVFIEAAVDAVQVDDGGVRMRRNCRPCLQSGCARRARAHGQAARCHCVATLPTHRPPGVPTLA
jgi:2-octaprenylphenol hydroxylase